MSVLPTGFAANGDAALGEGFLESPSLGKLRHAVSADGSRLYWTAKANGSGPLYLRLNPTQPQSALEHGSASGKGNLTSGSALVTELVVAEGRASLPKRLRAK